MKHYFTVEFLCDTKEQMSQVCREVQEQYDIALRKDSGIRVAGWRAGPMVEVQNEQAEYENK